MHWPAVERAWLPEWLYGRDAVLHRLDLAIARLRWTDANGEQLARVDSMVEQALKDDAEIDSCCRLSQRQVLPTTPVDSREWIVDVPQDPLARPRY
ncbi:hypothetical protein [Herbiconiux sp. YIM B11900]|uniref:hypothetical protein n=1 Tax=Herbiconiux sp. YIM B11900 TaxID=3404131 RepID=UPI003F83095A